MDDTKRKISQLFAALRKHDLIAKQNFACCMTCASTELGDMLDQDKTKKGAVFYHHQDAQRFARTGELYLGYIDALDNDQDGEPEQKRIARLIIDEATKLGLKTEWSGDTSERVLVRGD